MRRWLLEWCGIIWLQVASSLGQTSNTTLPRQWAVSEYDAKHDSTSAGHFVLSVTWVTCGDIACCDQQFKVSQDSAAAQQDCVAAVALLTICWDKVY